MAASYANAVLRALSERELALLEPHLERLHVRPRDVLQQQSGPIEYVYFPESGMVSLVLQLRDGRSAEIAAIGREGIVNGGVLSGAHISAFLAIGQVEGDVIRISRAHLAAADPDCRRLREDAARFDTYLFAVIGQNVACGQMHQIGERLARWLLTVKDVVGASQFKLTQEFMAEMLGANRPTVTLAARTLAQAGLIEYARGSIHILDEQGLEDSACECYATLRPEFPLLAD